jgi:hypothetical protein
MPFNRDDDDDKDDSLFDDVAAMADRLGIQGEKRANYIDDHMTAAGYERIQSRESYARVRDQDEEDESGGNRWFGPSRRGSRESSKERPGSRRGSSDDPDRF